MILNLFRNGYIYQYTDSEIVKDEYTGISVGLAPGGVVALWVAEVTVGFRLVVG